MGSKIACQNERNGISDSLNFGIFLWGGGGGGHAPRPPRGSWLWHLVLPPPTFIFKPSTPKLIENPVFTFISELSYPVLLIDVYLYVQLHTDDETVVGIQPDCLSPQKMVEDKVSERVYEVVVPETDDNGNTPASTSAMKRKKMTGCDSKTCAIKLYHF